MDSSSDQAVVAITHPHSSKANRKRAKARKGKEGPAAIKPSTPASIKPATPESIKPATPASIKPATPAAADTRTTAEILAAYRATLKEEIETDSDDESSTDWHAYEARVYRDFWNRVHAGDEFGTYDTVTSIPPMCFTDRGCNFAHARPTLQFFSVKVKEITGGLRWPLDVYGIVAVRDVVDHNRNIIFYRGRDNCQTINSKDPYLALTGPTRAVVVSIDPTYFEVDLKVKGTIESEDKQLSFLAVCYTSNSPSISHVIDRAEFSKLSTMEFTFGHINNSVEATISVEVTGGRWPQGYQGAFTAKTSSIDHMDVLLVGFEDGKLPVDVDRMVKLSRRVVCAELIQGEEAKVPKLTVSAQASINGGNNILKKDLAFKPKEAGRSHGKIQIGSCEMQVTIAWSLLSTFKFSYEEP